MKVAMSGCFDLLHDGHIILLKRALRWAKDEPNSHRMLNIFVNSDESVKRLKGDSRPVEDIEQRVKTITQTIYQIKVNEPGQIFTEVEFNITVFNTEQELAVGYDTFVPDIIIHGNDIKDPTKIVGADKHNILLTPKYKDFSTTKLIEEMNE